MFKNKGFASLALIIIALLVLGGGYWVWKGKVVAPTPTPTPVVETSSNITPAVVAPVKPAQTSDEKILEDIVLARMADAIKVLSPQDILSVVSKYNIQSSVEEMRSRLPDILLSNEQNKALFVTLYKMTVVDPTTIQFTSVKTKPNDPIAIVEFTSGNQKGTVFFRKEDGKWKITILAIKPPATQ